MTLVLYTRLKTGEATEYTLDPEYDEAEVQAEINQALDRREPVALLLANGNTIEVPTETLDTLAVGTAEALADIRKRVKL